MLYDTKNREHPAFFGAPLKNCPRIVCEVRGKHSHQLVRRGENRVKEKGRGSVNSRFPQGFMGDSKRHRDIGLHDGFAKRQKEKGPTRKGGRRGS